MKVQTVLMPAPRPPPQVEGVEIVLTSHEARMLTAILGSIGGPPGQREITQEALRLSLTQWGLDPLLDMRDFTETLWAALREELK